MFININYSLEIALHFTETNIDSTYIKKFNIDFENTGEDKIPLLISSIYNVLDDEIGSGESITITSVAITSDSIPGYTLLCEYDNLIIKVLATNNSLYVDNITANLYQDANKIFLNILNFNANFAYSIVINTTSPITISNALTEISNIYGDTLAAVLTIKMNTNVIKTINLLLELNTISANATTSSVLDTNLQVSIPPSDTELYFNGIGMKSENDLKVDIADVVDVNTFNLTAELHGTKTKSLTVYPKVRFDYNVTAEYDRDYYAVVGSFNYSIYAYQYGTVKAKITKYTTLDYSVKYNVTAKLCHFINKEWKVETITVAKSYDFNASPHVSYNYRNKRVLVNDKINDIVYDSQSPYEIILDAATTSGYTNGYYFIYDYSITSINCYDHNDNLITTNENSYIYPFFNITADNKVIANSKIMYKIRPFNIYYEEKYVTKTVGSTQINILQGFNFNFDLYEQSTDRVCKSNTTPIIEIMEKDSYVTTSIVGTVVNAKSNNIFNYTANASLSNKQTYYNLDVTSKLDLGKYVTSTTNNSFFISVTINCTKESIKVNGKTILANDDIKIETVYAKDVLNIQILGVIKKLTEHIKLYQPEDEYYTGSVNGDSATYQTVTAGKESYTSKEKPFLIPTDAYNIVYDVEIANVIPNNATVTYALIASPDTKQWSTYVVFNSTYTELINSIFSELITTASFYNNTIGNASKKQFQLLINKPGAGFTSYFAVVTSDNPNIIISYNKNITFTNSTYPLAVNAISTKHPAAKWYVTANTGYYYMDGEEYYFYSSNIKNITVTNKTAIINKKINCVAPLCVMKGLVSLSMVVSNYTDNISILETVKPIVNDLYLTYANVESVTITKDDVSVVDFTIYNNFIRLVNADPNAEYKVLYKVKDSFSYKLSEDSTTIYINSTNCYTIDVYFDEDTSITTDISVNPIHSSFTDGYIYIEPTAGEVARVNKYINNYNNIYTVYFELLDANNNPIKSNVSITTSDANLIITKNDTSSDQNGIACLKFTAAMITGNEQVNITAQGKIFTVKLFL